MKQPMSSGAIFLAIVMLSILWVNNKDGYQQRKAKNQKAEVQWVNKQRTKNKVVRVNKNPAPTKKNKIKAKTKPVTKTSNFSVGTVIFGLEKTSDHVWKYPDRKIAYEQARVYQGAKEYPAAPIVKDDECKYENKVIKVNLDSKKYPASALHFVLAFRRGVPKIFHVGKKKVNIRNNSLRGIPTKPGMDRDEIQMNATWEGQYDASLGEARQPKEGLADIAWIPLSDNRGSGSSIGSQISKYCTGQAFKIVLDPPLG